MAGFGALIDLTVESNSKQLLARTSPNHKETKKPRDPLQGTKNTPRLASAPATLSYSQSPLGWTNRHSKESRNSLGSTKQTSKIFDGPRALASPEIRTSPELNTSGGFVEVIDRPILPALRESTTKSFVDLTKDDGENKAPSQPYKHQHVQKALCGELGRAVLTDSDEGPPFRIPPLMPSGSAGRKSASSPVISPTSKFPGVGISKISPSQDSEAPTAPNVESPADWAVLRSSAQKSATEAAVVDKRHWDDLPLPTERNVAKALPDSPRPKSGNSDLSGLAGAAKEGKPACKEHSKAQQSSNAMIRSVSVFDFEGEDENDGEDEADVVVENGDNNIDTKASTASFTLSGADDEDTRRKSLMNLKNLLIPAHQEAVEMQRPEMENTHIPVLLASFQEIMQKHVRELREDHEYYMKLRLLRARRKSERQVPNTRKNLTSGKSTASDIPTISTSRYTQDTSPFAALKTSDLTFRTPTDRSIRSPGKLHQHLIRGSKQESLKLTAPRTSYGCSTTKLPPYTNYISSMENILTEDEAQTTYFPYHGDHPPIDADYYAFEARVGESIRRFQMRNDYAEKATHYAPYAARFLAEVGCDFQDVLHYLIDETDPDVPVEMLDASADCWLNRESHLDEDYYISTDAEDGESDVTVPRRGRPKPISEVDRPRRKRRPPSKWQSVFKNLPTSQPRTSAVAGLACAAFRKIAGFSIWHIAKTYPLPPENTNCEKRPRDVIITSGRGRGVDEEPNLLGTYMDLGCLVCFAHECPGHGEFAKGNGIDNTRVRANTKPLSPKSARNNAIEVSQSIDLTQLIGMNDDGSVSGLRMDEMTDLDTGFADDEICSDSCFWKKTNRAGLDIMPWLDQDRVLLQALLPAYVRNKRAACMLALAIRKPCVEIFYAIQQPSNKPNRISVKARNLATMSHRSGPKRNGEYWHEHSKTWKHHDRPPFRPCNHIGPCSVANECSCCIEGVTCEKTCMCTDNCSRRFQGCSCATRGKVCWGNDKCDCFFLDRECDPDLCGTCGARQILDPVNRYKDVIAKGKCTNVYVQRGVPKHTLLGHSKLLASGGVSGWGLYMGEPVKTGDYLGEYVGEVISNEESERRGQIYNKRNLSYLFDLNSGQTLDSTRIGNKFRYINHQSPPYANCRAKVLLCNTVHRIGMFALRNIEIGEELLFDYGPGFADQFVAVKLHPNAPPTLERPKKGVAQKVPSIRHATAKKTGARIGRPRKYSPNGTPIKKLKIKHRSKPKGLEHLSAGSLGLDDLFDLPSDRVEVLGGEAEVPGSEEEEVAMSEEGDFELGTSSEDESYLESDEMEIEDPIPVSPSSKKKEKEKAEPEYENPQKRGWKTRYANMLKRKRGL